MCVAQETNSIATKVAPTNLGDAAKVEDACEVQVSTLDPAATNATQEPTAQERSVRQLMLPLQPECDDAAAEVNGASRASLTEQFAADCGASDDEEDNDEDENEDGEYRHKELNALRASVEVGTLFDSYLSE